MAIAFKSFVTMGEEQYNKIFLLSWSLEKDHNIGDSWKTYYCPLLKNGAVLQEHHKVVN